MNDRQHQLQTMLDFYTTEMATKKLSYEEIGAEYERYIGYCFTKRGFEVFYNGIVNQLKDGGIDLIAKRRNQVYIVQCKKWSRKKVLESNVVDQLHGAHDNYVAEHHLEKNNVIPVLVTSTTASEEAKAHARNLNILLFENVRPGYFPRIKCYIDETGNKLYKLPLDDGYDEQPMGQYGSAFHVRISQAEDAGYTSYFYWSDRESDHADDIEPEIQSTPNKPILNSTLESTSYSEIIPIISGVLMQHTKDCVSVMKADCNALFAFYVWNGLFYCGLSGTISISLSDRIAIYAIDKIRKEFPLSEPIYETPDGYYALYEYLQNDLHEYQPADITKLSHSLVFIMTTIVNNAWDKDLKCTLAEVAQSYKDSASSLQESITATLFIFQNSKQNCAVEKQISVQEVARVGNNQYRTNNGINKKNQEVEKTNKENRKHEIDDDTHLKILKAIAYNILIVLTYILPRAYTGSTDFFPFLLYMIFLVVVFPATVLSILFGYWDDEGTLSMLGLTLAFILIIWAFGVPKFLG